MKKNRIFQFLTVITLIIGLSSCGGGSKKLMKKATGKPGSLVVVVPDNIWNGPAGTSIREFLAQPVPSLPQDEPVLDVINIPNQGFTDIFRTTRNILLVKVDDRLEKNQISFAKDVWSTPQTVIHLKAKSEKELIDLFTKNQRKILSYYLRAEYGILMDTYSKETFRNKPVGKYLLKKYNINMNFPKGFQIAKDVPNFSWIRYESRETSQGVFVWSTPYTDESQFKVENLVAMRDSILKANVEGPAPHSFMTTEKRIETLSRVFKLNGNYAKELRGLWKVEGDFMGGPWVSISVLDVIKKRIITVDGYLYSPKMDKRNLLRQVEAILRSVSFPYQKKLDMANNKIDQMNVDITVKPTK
ncbi:DUF4837 family protein [Halosquirtibacter xylanolyticus]|uniref:DUF4837 family protein n=1 Tax=Halosquirtibacter xylanolyticus TaxID=3374599 RepID=UPI0037485D1D|nr:DUF4837 family protein [Prolixibacteraceae bacterium]